MTATAPLFVSGGSGFGPPNIRLEQAQSTLFARIVGSGIPTASYLTSPLTSSGALLGIGPLTGSYPNFPPVPFDVKFGEEIATCTEVVTPTALAISRSQELVSPVPVYPVGTLVEFLRVGRSRPLVFNEVTPVQTTAGSVAGYVDNPNGILGLVNGAPITDEAAAVFSASSLGSGSVSGSPGAYTCAIDTSAAYEVNGEYVPDDGSCIVQLFQNPGEPFYRFFRTMPEPFWAFLTSKSNDIDVVPILTANVLIGDEVIQTSWTPSALVAGQHGFPPFPSASTSWLIQIGTELMLASYQSQIPSGNPGIWTVVRGWEGSQIAAHSAGANVTLINFAFGWVEATQDYQGRWVPLQGERSSDDNPNNTFSQPAYPVQQVYNYNYGGGGPVLLKPAIAPNSMANYGTVGGNTRYWIFEWPAPQIAGYLTIGMIGATSGAYQAMGAGWKIFDTQIVIQSSYTGVVSQANDYIFGQNILSQAGVIHSCANGSESFTIVASDVLVQAESIEIANGDILIVATTGVSGPTGNYVAELDGNTRVGLTGDYSGGITELKFACGVPYFCSAGGTGVEAVDGAPGGGVDASTVAGVVTVALSPFALAATNIANALGFGGGQ